jgi:FkbM family methyltransferase
MLRSKEKFLDNRAYQSIKYSIIGKMYSSVAKKNNAELSREIDFYSGFISNCNLIFDIGANDGHKTIVFSRLAKKVIACEPDTYNLETLEVRFTKDKNVVIEPVALSDHSGSATLHIHKPGSALNSLNEEWQNILNADDGSRWPEKIEFSGDTLEVKTITLDELIRKHGKPDFVKIDVEGHEKRVLKGLNQSVDCISFELLLPEFLNDAMECIDHLLSIDSRYTFSYAVNESLVLKEFITASAFKNELGSLSIPHLEIVAKLP